MIRTSSHFNWELFILAALHFHLPPFLFKKHLGFRSELGVKQRKGADWTVDRKREHRGELFGVDGETAGCNQTVS